MASTSSFYTPNEQQTPAIPDLGNDLFLLCICDIVGFPEVDHPFLGHGLDHLPDPQQSNREVKTEARRHHI